jgi:hypothetical protein
MTVPYRIFIALGLAAGLLGAGYAFAPLRGATALPTAPVTKAAPAAASAATPAAPTAKPSALVANRAPVPMAPRTHATYYAPKEADAAIQTASATTTTGPMGANTDGGLPPGDDTKSGGGAEAKAAIELDGYKNVRGLEKGPDGMWRGRAMRGRTEITVRVDATGSVSAE